MSAMLSPKYQEIAKNELREDESRKSQALKQFEEGLDKHAFIRNCRRDPNYLLSFLRAKKFSVPQALEVLERNLMVRQKYPQWYQKLDFEDKKIAALYKTGYILPLSQKDEQGRQVILTRGAQIDPEIFTSTDSIRLNTLIYSCCLEDLECQIAGFVHIVDAKDVTLKHMGLFSISDLTSWLKSIEKSAPIRQKEYHFVNFPSFTNTFVELATSLLSEKLQKRVFLHKDLESLKKVVDVKILPSEYGGNTSAADMLKTFEAKAESVKNNIRDTEKMYMEESHISEKLESFTKLEID